MRPSLKHLAAALGAVVVIVTLDAFAFVRPAHAQPTAPENFSATAQGEMVTLTWAQNNDFRRTYILEAGSGPGLTDIASFPVPFAGVSWYNLNNVPNGTYYVRLRAVLFSQLSAPSNEVMVTVTGCAEPPAPLALEGNVYGQLVVVQWRFPAWPPGCFPSSLRLQAGSSPGASDVLDMNVPDWNITQRQFESVPFGTYYVRVLVDRHGVPGGPSNEVRLDVGCSPPPQILNPRAEVVGNAARYFWGYSNSQTADFNLVLEAGAAPGGAEVAAVPVPFRALTGFNVEGVAGTYYTRLRATNACGSTVSPEVPVTLTAECVAPDPIPLHRRLDDQRFEHPQRDVGRAAGRGPHHGLRSGGGLVAGVGRSGQAHRGWPIRHGFRVRVLGNVFEPLGDARASARDAGELVRPCAPCSRSACQHRKLSEPARATDHVRTGERQQRDVVVDRHG